ncbi:hypothetical protein PC41400_23945 [Paenibacillus chitinolyticus]|uniref:Uncharacterized protein n=1 Tax=Paenibacillus chitinolyticus TaxID=79263 RepID=A0A410X1S2_9BACL|nr:hypothetical protein [Paenibacillus chitinolyticus]MCY9592651.1 hypothetical protein [Paenibacillus chitinolyticus]MCY9594746.1 hypothetical protein [Paenibacillus chitinolyticus]QAV20563.1 hypothetical protein PC41400_23945 [Paenibacillus chitinolyticus]
MGSNRLAGIRKFITNEKERTLSNIRNGTIGKEQATGSLNTLYQLAADIQDIHYMKEISSTIALLRSASDNWQRQGALISQTIDSAVYRPGIK